MSCGHCHTHHPLLRWFLGAGLAILALVALFLAAGGSGFYGHGLMLFVLCVAGVFRLMRTSFDEEDARHTTTTPHHHAH